MTVSAAKKLGQILIDKHALSAQQLAEGLALQEHENRPLTTILLERGWVTPEQVLEGLAEQYHMPFVRLEDAEVSGEAVAKVPMKIALHYQVMPLRLRNSTLTVAIADPQDVRLLDEFRLALQQRYTLEPVLAAPEDIGQAIRKHYGVGAETINKILSDRSQTHLATAAPEEQVEELEGLAAEASVVNLVSQVILEAHHRRATDIHLEPFRTTVRLRYRVDGMLHDAEAPGSIRQLFPAIVSRVKVLSNLNIVERRLPQDGRASVKVGGEKLDLRISVLPTPMGESIVIRILPNQMLLDLKDLGYREEDRQILEAIIGKPHGLMFVTGPTGSGKTTTLYACVKTINAVERKIITIEDPIEYELEGVTQVQVNPQIGLTFAQGLRSMLRHDPNVMMVGEVRDPETAELAIRIALTGHLVLSTLHTNDAVGGIARLMDMGIDPYLIASSVECLVAQRLVRVLCPSCKEQVAVNPALAGQGGVKRPEVEMDRMFKSRGCKHCHQTGFRGRTAIYEFFPMSQPVKDLVIQRATADAIRKTVIDLGMRTLREDGWDKVKAGVTTLDEVLRVTQDET